MVLIFVEFIATEILLKLSVAPCGGLEYLVEPPIDPLEEVILFLMDDCESVPLLLYLWIYLTSCSLGLCLLVLDLSAGSSSTELAERYLT